MSTAEQWAGALAGQGSGDFTLRFDRLGLEAQCRPLNAGEVEECVRMGGQRGLRYALYLACDQLREAGESLKKQGNLASAFDITEKLSYGDVVAAGAAILGRSGADSSAVRVDGGPPAVTEPMAVSAEQSFLTGEQVFSRLTGRVGMPERVSDGEEGLFVRRSLELQDLMDGLTAAAGNR